MPLRSFQELYESADRLETPTRVVAAGGADTTVIQALELARRRGWVEPILTGPVRDIEERASLLECDLSPFQVVEDRTDSASVAVELIRSGAAEVLMKGQIPTPMLMKAVLNKEKGLRSGTTIGQVVLMEITRDQRRFLMSDTGIAIAPTLDQKRELLQNLAEIAHRLGCDIPRIALLSATEKVTDALPDTLESHSLVEEFTDSTEPKILVQGPLSFDLAYATDAGSKKGIGGEVTGSADALLFPNLLAANLTVKGIMYTADCQFGGILCGTTHPVVFMSRADTVETRLNSLAYALALNHDRQRSSRDRSAMLD